MPSAHHRHVLLAVLALCAAGLAGCNVNLTNQTPSYWAKAGDTQKLKLLVEPGAGATVQAVEVNVNGQPHAMTPSGTTWTYDHVQPLEPDGHVRGLNVFYRVTYKYASLLVIPTQGVARLPASGEFQIPILYQDADSDGDYTPAAGPGQPMRGGLDRWDNCIFQPNPDQAMGPWYMTSLNSIRLGKLCDPTEPGLDHIDVSQGGGGNVVLMRDNTGSLMLTENNRPYRAFKTLVSSTGTIVNITGVNGLSAATRTVEISDCNLVYQDGDNGRGAWFMEVYAAEGAQACSFAIKQGGATLLTGGEVLIMVRTRVEQGYEHTADMYGRVTLNPPPSGAPADAQALFTALTANSPVHYAYFVNPKLSTLVDTGGSVGPTVEGRFGGSSYIVFRH